jgi:enamine deaminase RidA (YjgF/YER057c/UK114 family)
MSGAAGAGGRVASSTAQSVGEPFLALSAAGGRLYLGAVTAQAPDGTIEGAGDPAAQADAALRRARALLERHNASLRDVGKIAVSYLDRAHRAAIDRVLQSHFPGGVPCRSDFAVDALADPELLVQFDLDAVRSLTRPADAAQGAGVIGSAEEIFLSAQSAPSSADDRMDAGAQADAALGKIVDLLGQVGGSVKDVCKITVSVADRADREAVYPMIGRHLGGVFPVSTGLVVREFAQPQTRFAIDVVAARQAGAPHRRVRSYHTNAARYGLSGQALECGFCMAVRAGSHAHLRGQTGMDLNEQLQGLGDAAAQAEQAMENVRVLLGEAGARMEDVVKARLYVTGRAYLQPCTQVLARHLAGARCAFSSVVIKGLAAPELLMEVDIVAAVKDAS